MQLTIRVNGKNAKMISHLLAKNPHNRYERTEKGSKVRLVYTIFQEELVEVFLYVTPDPIELVRNSPETFDITQYINDREFAVNSLFCSYIRSALGTALNGKPKEAYQNWVDYQFALELSFGPISSKMSDEYIQKLFEPMGYEVRIKQCKTQNSTRFLTISANQTLQNAMKHLFVLIPVVDDYKHYFLDEREQEKLERFGEGWLADHPLRSFIIKRSLRFSKLISSFPNSDDQPVREEKEKKIRLNDLRYEAILERVANLERKETIVDFGSGEGKLSTHLGFLTGVREILAVEPSQRAQLHAMERFEKAKRRPNFAEVKPQFGSLFYLDERLCQKDVMILCEVMEHIDEDRLPNVMQTIFRYYQPTTLLMTTPNHEYNEVYEMQQKFRHRDHRFEWTRQEFMSWCNSFTKEYPYDFTYQGIGDEHDQFGHPSQMAIFTKRELK